MSDDVSTSAAMPSEYDFLMGRHAIMALIFPHRLRCSFARYNRKLATWNFDRADIFDRHAFANLGLLSSVDVLLLMRLLIVIFLDDWKNWIEGRSYLTNAAWATFIFNCLLSDRNH